MKLQIYKDWTVDYKLEQFRACKGGWENHGEITFVDFDSDKGDKILCNMIDDNAMDYTQWNP